MSGSKKPRPSILQNANFGAGKADRDLLIGVQLLFKVADVKDDAVIGPFGRAIWAGRALRVWPVSLRCFSGLRPSSILQMARQSHAPWAERSRETRPRCKRQFRCATDSPSAMPKVSGPTGRLKRTGKHSVAGFGVARWSTTGPARVRDRPSSRPAGRAGRGRAVCGRAGRNGRRAHRASGRACCPAIRRQRIILGFGRVDADIGRDGRQQLIPGDDEIVIQAPQHGMFGGVALADARPASGGRRR